MLICAIEILNIIIIIKFPKKHCAISWTQVKEEQRLNTRQRGSFPRDLNLKKRKERNNQTVAVSWKRIACSVREVASRAAESSKHSSATMTALQNPPQEAGKDNSLGRANCHISRSELRSSSSGAVHNVQLTQGDFFRSSRISTEVNR